MSAIFATGAPDEQRSAAPGVAWPKGPGRSKRQSPKAPAPRNSHFITYYKDRVGDLCRSSRAMDRVIPVHTCRKVFFIGLDTFACSSHMLLNSILWKMHCCIGVCAWCLHVLLPNTIYVCLIHCFPHVIYVYVAFVLYIISHVFSVDSYTVYMYARMPAACL